MSYALENMNESDRLKHQEGISVYCLDNDLKGINFRKEDIVLDAGCGAGVISLHLKKNYQFKSLEACDFSEIRLKQAENFLKESKVDDVIFYKCDLRHIPREDNHYNKVVCRFVYEYLEDPLAVTKEFHRVCKDGGEVVLIDLDGVAFNLVSSNKELSAMIVHLNEEAASKHNLDFFAGRKLYSHMISAGFKNVQYEVRPMVFKGKDLKDEIKNYVERFSFGKKILDAVFGPEKAQVFVDLYLSELNKEGNILFYNNFIVTGTK